MPKQADEAVLNTIVEAALDAGTIVRQYFSSPEVEVREKTSPADLVTNVDMRVHDSVSSIFRREHPKVALISEEGENAPATEETVYVDPVDGTLNFVHGFPQFAVSVGYWREGAPVAAAVHNPISGELYTALRGKGARLNGKRISVSTTPRLCNSLLATGWPYDKEDRTRIFDRIERGYLNAQEIRTLGSASLSLCYVAAGIMDGYWEFDLYPWDMAAGALIVLEAGGRLSSLKGGPFHLEKGSIVASNGRIHSELVRKVTR